MILRASRSSSVRTILALRHYTNSFTEPIELCFFIMSDAEEKDIPSTEPSAPTNPTTASTATAPSYSPIYATAQPSSMTALPTPADLAGNPTATIAPLHTSSSSPSPPPPQPGAIPEPPTSAEPAAQSSNEAHPLPPAPAPKGGLEPTPAPIFTPPAQKPPSPAPHPPVITAAPTYPPPTSSSTSAYLPVGINPASDPSQTPQTAAPPNGPYGYPASTTTTSAPVSGQGYNYPSSYGFTPTPTTNTTTTYQQPTYPNPNSTTTPYSTVYSPPAPSTSTTLPLHTDTHPHTNSTDSNPVSQPESGIWGSTKSFLQNAGNKLAEVEAEVWRRINDAHEK
ncbi:hypothetical protein BJY04DRAFT_189618 [Aspergillus karnatakaensis]|uniref:uncharacterized protein n=1 Tax=Aspergillus karnatakaensis TaxID=1810916 RepID=UPI003CCDF53D